MTYLVIDADEWEIAGHEQAGLTPHDWLRHPETSDLWLWKPVIARRTHRYEHWAEKVVSELALALGVPCAAVELARRLDTDGCLSRNVRPSGWSIHSGAEIIAALLPSFDPRATPAAGYDLDAVEEALAAVEAPTAEAVLGLPPSCQAFDVFAGYLMLDAVVANTDRHARNWSILRWRGRDPAPDALCPLYDNASALGFSIPAMKRERMLRERRVGAWADNGVARSFATPSGRPAGLVPLAVDALRRCPPTVRDHWLGRLAALSAISLDDVVGEIPSVSEVTRTFAVEVVSHNRERILDACA